MEKREAKERRLTKTKKMDRQKITIIVLAGVAVILAATLIVLSILPKGIGLSNGAVLKLPYAARTAAIEAEKQLLEEHPEYEGTLLLKTKDAGKTYIEDTVFVGDSNSLRISMFNLVPLKNTLAVEGMGVQSAINHPGIYWQGYENPTTILKAATMTQPRRMIVCFGTNNLLNNNAEWFIESYEQFLDELEEAYEYAEIIIAAVPPVSANYSQATAFNKTVKAYNTALIEMAKERGLRFLNTYEIFANAPGAMKSEYIESDGIHLTKKACQDLLEYVRTHSTDVEDMRPKPLESVPNRRQAPKPVVEEEPAFSAPTAAANAVSMLLNSGFKQASGSIDYKTAINSMSFSYADADAKAGTEAAVATEIYNAVKASYSSGIIAGGGSYNKDTKTHTITIYFFADTSTPTVDKSALQAAIGAIQSKLATNIAESGASVPVGQTWITSAEAGALNSALAAAQAVYNNAAATQAEVDAAAGAANAAAAAVTHRPGEYSETPPEPPGGEG